jgi:hypothetical protein
MSKIILILGLILSVLAGCERNPVKPAKVKPSESVNVSTSDSLSVSDSDSLGTLILTIERENEYYKIKHWDDQVRINGPHEKDNYSSEYFSFESDTLIISKPCGDFRISFYPYVWINCPNYSYHAYISIHNDITIERNKTVQKHIVIPHEAPFQIVVMSEWGRTGSVPIRGAQVSTEPETATGVTDEEGRTDFGTLLLSNYRYFNNEFVKYVIRKNNFELDGGRSYRFSNINGVFMETVTIALQPPEVEIITPDNLHYENTFEILLQGDGDDFENDPFPDEYLVWYSNIDGELGSGRNLTASNLSEGNHIITLVGTDTHELTAQDSISMEISYYDDESYFPLPYTGYWNYRYETADFTVSDELRGTEYWTLNELQVSADNVDTRNCIMEYTITRGDSTKYCRYEVTDHYETDADNIYLTKTTEQLDIYNDENMIADPTEQLDIETVYSPRYLLIEQYMNLDAVRSYEASGTAEVNWEYHNVNSYTQTHVETIDINTSYEFGEPETVETGIGNYEAVPLTIISEGTERTWWLAKGIGIVRLAYDSFGFPLTATMTDTNVPSFSGVGPSVVMKSSVRGNNNNWVAFNSLPDTPERIVELSQLLRGLCPR